MYTDDVQDLTSIAVYFSHQHCSVDETGLDGQNWQISPGPPPAARCQSQLTPDLTAFRGQREAQLQQDQHTLMPSAMAPVHKRLAASTGVYCRDHRCGNKGPPLRWHQRLKNVKGLRGLTNILYSSLVSQPRKQSKKGKEEKNHLVPLCLKRHSYAPYFMFTTVMLQMFLGPIYT